MLVLKVLCLLLPILLAIAYLTLAERKVLGSIQGRLGPTVVGIWGCIQPLVDGIKLFSKEMIWPNNANITLYLICPLLSFTLSIMSWGPLPFGIGFVLSDLEVGILFILALSSISVYAVLISGWSSNSKYSFLGAIRGAAQMISYEVSIGLIILSVVLCVGSLNFNKIVASQSYIWYFIPLFPASFMFFVSALAETNRTPFDLTEGESELVSGFNVEYSSMSFGLFFLSEYCHILLMCALGSLLFLGGGMVPGNSLLSPGWLAVKICIIVFVFILIRGAYPRIRYDQLMSLLWKTYLPFSFAILVFVSGYIIGLNDTYL